MGTFWLHDALVPLHVALGTKFHTYQNYQIRCRSSGGFNAIRGIVMHHDADGTSGEDNWVLKYEYETAKDGPIGNFHVTRTGDVWFGAAGASNHAGRGGPVSTSRGTVPINTGNLYLIGIEASNNGLGEVWGSAILNSYLTLVTELCRVFKLDPMEDIYSHWTWVAPSCPNRKVDPSGPTPSYPKLGGTSGNNKWNMDEVRKEISTRLGKPPPNAALRPPIEKPEEDTVTDEDIERIAERAADLVWAEQFSTAKDGVKPAGWILGQNYTLTQRSVKASEEAAANTRD